MTKKFMEQQHTTKQREMKTSGNNFFFCVACVPLALGLIFFYFYYFSMILLSFQLMLLHLTSQLNHSGPYYFLRKLYYGSGLSTPICWHHYIVVLFCKYYYMYRQVLTKPQGDLIKRTTVNRAHQVASLRESQIDGEKPFYPDRDLFLLLILALLLCSIDPLI